jgi:hypothetical protein
MKGEYTGSDGRRYRWCQDLGGYYLTVENKASGIIRPADLDLAFAALAEMKDEGEWVEWEMDGFQYRGNHQSVRYRRFGEYEWAREINPHIPAAFRAGRSAALGSVKELAEAVEAVPLLGVKVVPSNDPFWSWVNQVIALARKCKGVE